MTRAPIIQALDNVIKREIAEADLVRAEIKTRGTHWAGGEIWRLRRLVASLCAELEKAKQL